MSTHKELHFPPLSQMITLYGADGEKTVVPLDVVETTMMPRLVNCSAYTSHIAMCAGVLFVLLITTQRDRLKTPIHIFNILSLISSIVYSTGQYINMTGPIFQIAVQELNDTTSVSQGYLNFAYAVPILGSIVVGFVEFSLVLQCRSVFASYKSTKKWMTLITVLIATAVTLWCTAVDVHRILSFHEHRDFGFLDRSKNVVFAFSIMFFSSIFVTKLWKSIRSRRNLGFRQFGPLQVIFIMACQTMILPLIFCLAGLFYPQQFALTHTARVMVVINLPLSSVWAAAQADMTADDNVSSLMPSFFQTLDSDFSMTSNNAVGLASRPKFDETKNMDLTIGTYLASKGYKDIGAL